MDQVNYQAISGAGVGDKNGGSAPHLTPLPSYHATYSFENAPADARTRRRARARFLHAFVFASLLLVFLHVGLRHFKPLPHAWTHWGHRQHDIDFMPPLHRTCSHPASWTFDPDNRSPIEPFHHVAEASFELPVSADTLFFTSQGSAALAHGIIEIVDSSETSSDVVKVDITSYYNHVEDFLELTQACLLHHEEGKYGVGIFAPMHWPYHDKHRQVRWKVKVQLPKSSDGSPLSIKKLETAMPTFLHEVGDLARSVFFDTLLLQTTNMPVTVKSVTGHSIGVKSSNGPIEGSFNTSESLDLRTSNAPVYVGVGLLNEGTDAPTRLSIHTSNGPVSSNMSLYSTSESNTGGSFVVDIRSSNSPLKVAVVDAPVDHTLFMKAHTSNSPAHVVLHKTYEGAFDLSSSRFFRPTVQADEDVEDPAGRGRHRNVALKKLSGGVAEGSVQWLPSDRETRVGWVQMSTSNMGIHLSL